ncbi:hypothetical protein BJ912DRAFT_1044175 [Pholiota molesta]|nr:hypothetical protein BJ912DRAFT_1044175 [Pholiota molesta]
MFSQPLATGGYNSTYFTPQPNSTDSYLQYGQPQQQAIYPQYAALRPQLGNANALALRGPRNNFQGAHPNEHPHQQQNVSAPHAQVGQSHTSSPPLALSASTSSESAYTGDLQYPGPFSAESDTMPLAGPGPSRLISLGSTYTGELAATQYSGPFSGESETMALAGPSTLTSSDSNYTGELAATQYSGPFSAKSDTRPFAGPTRKPKARRARTPAYTRPPLRRRHVQTCRSDAHCPKSAAPRRSCAARCSTASSRRRSMSAGTASTGFGMTSRGRRSLGALGRAVL